MALIDTDKIAQQFGQQTADLIVKAAAEGLSAFNSIIGVLETKDLVITVRLQDRI